MKPKRSSKHAEWLKQLYADGNAKLKGSGPKVAPEEPRPDLYPDLIWLWEAYCFLSESRAVGNNGPLPIRPADMLAYCQLTGRDEMLYRQQIIRFIPVLDRYYLKDFYDKQAKEMEKQRRAMEAKQHNSRSR